jgi:membrane-associated protease RseP (regulator of RpoE activity)
MAFSSRCLVPSIMILTLTGCVQHTFAPGPGMSAMDYEPDTANCRIFSRGATPGFGFSASGSPKFVAGSMVGAAIGAGIASAIIQNQNYNDCMQARGWRVVDGLKPAPAVTVPPTPQPVAPVATVAATPPPRPLPVAMTTTASSTSAKVISLSPTVTAPLANRREFLVKAADVDATRADLLRMEAPRGVVLLDVLAGGAAASSGLKPGDVLLAFNGSSVRDVNDLVRNLAVIPAGGQAQFRIWRNDTEQSLTVRF